MPKYQSPQAQKEAGIMDHVIEKITEIAKETLTGWQDGPFLNPKSPDWDEVDSPVELAWFAMALKVEFGASAPVELIEGDINPLARWMLANALYLPGQLPTTSQP